jgi:hypothetical protein
MDPTTDQIETDLAQTREHLRSNIQELETRVKDVTDWRLQFRRHPLPMVVAAMLGGVLLSAIVGGRDARH